MVYAKDNPHKAIWSSLRRCLVHDGIHCFARGFLEGLAQCLRLLKRSIHLVDPNLEPAYQPRLDRDLRTYTRDDRRHRVCHPRFVGSCFESSDLPRFARIHFASVPLLQEPVEC